MAEAAGGTEAQRPLLDDLEEQARGEWRSQHVLTLDRAESEGQTEQCTVTELLRDHQSQVLHYLQEKGVAFLGSFPASDAAVFPAFEKEPLLTFGADARRLDWEARWRAELGRARSAEHDGGWHSDVEVQAYVVTIRGAARSGKAGLLRPLLRRWMARRCSFAVFSLPAVQAVILYKWRAFAHRFLLLQLAWFTLLWLIPFNVFTVAFQDEDLSLSLADILGTARGRVTVAAELLCLFGMLPFLALEAGTIQALGWQWLDAWNTLDVCTYVIQVAVTTLHLGRFYTKSQLLTGLLALQCILLVLRLQYYTQVFKSSRFSFFTTIKGVWEELRPYVAFLLLVMWAFATAFHITFRRDQKGHEEYATIWHAFLAMFEHQYGDIEMKPMYESKSPAIATALGVAYTFVMGMVLINLIIGVTLQALDKVQDHEGQKMLANQARVIDELEALIPTWVERRCPHWHLPFIHALRINPERLDAVELDSLWASMGREEPEILGGGDEGGGGNGGGSGKGSCPAKEHPEEAGQGAGWRVAAEAEERSGERGKGKSEEESSEGGPSGGQGHTKNGRRGGGREGTGGADDADARLEEMQRQLEEQGRLLRELCQALGPARQTEAEGQGRSEE